MREAVIIEALRTPIGKGKHGSKGALSAFHPAHLLATVQAAVVAPAGLDPAEVEQIIVAASRRRASSRTTSPGTRG